VSAPLLWIFAPLVLAGLLLFPRSQRVVGILACIFTLFLAAAAWLLPIDVALAAGGGSFKIAPSLEILGRHLTLTSADRSVLALIYGSAFFWFLPASLIKTTRRLIPLGLAITALLVASLAVEPFLYAALLIEMAVLLSLPILAAPGQKPGRGVIRFLIFQTLAMPFILFSGWLLAGIEASPGDLSLVQQAALLLGVGFAFLLAVFPFYTWIPLLTEEADPYAVGFILWMFPTVTIFFGLGFVDHYSWLRDSPVLTNVLIAVGALMVVSGGLFAAFQRHFGRIMGYAVIVETGLSLLAVSLGSSSGLLIFLLLLVPRALSLGIWALSLSILREHHPDLTFENLKGRGRIWPYAASGLVLANLTLAGLPLLAGFPAHQALWEGLAGLSLPLALWVLIGNLGLFASSIRTLAAFISSPEGSKWEARETPAQRVLLAAGWLGLVLLGLFPHWALPLWTKLPVIFEHLGQ
jgi:formate hydrogenlyase subunit 3/multisubunit Na+/H+ antiporter MnhD subunit